MCDTTLMHFSAHQGRPGYMQVLFYLKQQYQEHDKKNISESDCDALCATENKRCAVFKYAQGEVSVLLCTFLLRSQDS